MNEKYMLRALELAQVAAEAGDVPVGAVIVKEGEIIAEAYNERERAGDASSHAEMLAIRRACERLGRWRLSDCEMYITLEPCPMCAGAILNARISRIYFSLKDARSGAFGSVIDLNSYPLLHKVEVGAGMCAEESRRMLGEFFKSRREENKK